MDQQIKFDFIWLSTRNKWTEMKNCVSCWKTVHALLHEHFSWNHLLLRLLVTNVTWSHCVFLSSGWIKLLDAQQFKGCLCIPAVIVITLLLCMCNCFVRVLQGDVSNSAFLGNPKWLHWISSVSHTFNLFSFLAPSMLKIQIYSNHPIRAAYTWCAGAHASCQHISPIETASW